MNKKYAVHCKETIEYVIYVDAQNDNDAIEIVKDKLPSRKSEVNSEFHDFYSEPMSDSK